MINDVRILMLGSFFLVILFVAGLLAMFYIARRFNEIVNDYEKAICELKKENEDITAIMRENMKEILNILKEK